jgi:hypothetical protein
MKKLIGRGSFTWAYLIPNEKVLLVSRCPIKECMSFGWFPESPLFPTLECLGWADKEDFKEYEMEYYPKVRSLKNNLDPDQYQIYKDLRALQLPFGILNKHDYFQEWHKLFDTLQNEELRDIMKEALDACSNYGSDIGFEISPRNVATKNGKLILLDCFYQITKLQGI